MKLRDNQTFLSLYYEPNAVEVATGEADSFTSVESWQRETKQLGQVATPEPIAALMAKWVMSAKPCTVLDPAAGLGGLLAACRALNAQAALGGVAAGGGGCGGVAVAGSARGGGGSGAGRPGRHRPTRGECRRRGGDFVEFVLSRRAGGGVFGPYPSTTNIGGGPLAKLGE